MAPLSITLPTNLQVIFGALGVTPLGDQSTLEDQVFQVQDGVVSPCFQCGSWDDTDSVWVAVDFFDANLPGVRAFVMSVSIGNEEVGHLLVLADKLLVH